MSIRKRSTSRSPRRSIDTPKSLRSIARNSAQSALRENKALGLPVTYMNRGRVIQEQPDGKKNVIGRREAGRQSYNVSKGDVIRVKKD